MIRTEKPWGYEELIEANDEYMVKYLFMRGGERCSLQSHQKKRETVMALEGILTVLCEGQTLKIEPFKTITINPGEVHRMSAGQGDCIYVECSTPELEDTVRVEDDYGRKPVVEYITPEEFVDKLGIDLPKVMERLVAIGQQEYVATILAESLPAVRMEWLYFAAASLVLGCVDNVLEIGTMGGASTEVLAALFPQATIYTVDRKNPEDSVVGKDKSQQTPRDRRLNRENIVTVRSNSFFLPSLNLPEQFEVIYVDGDHEFPQVAGDIMFGYNSVRPHGFVFMHDYVPTTTGKYWDVAATINWMASRIQETIFALPHFSGGHRPPRLIACFVKGGMELYSND